MARALLQRCVGAGTPGPDGECAAGKAKRQGRAGSLVAETLGEAGRPLDPATRDSFERQTGHDFGAVRIHTGTTAGRSAEGLAARAYTVGRDIVFGAGRYQPESAEGRRLLAHELTHVRQQEGPQATGPVALLDDPAAEREADEAAGRSEVRRVEPSLQRDEDPLLRLDPEFMRPPLLFAPGSLRETYILPAPPLITIRPPSLFEPRDPFPRLLDTPLQGPAPFTPVQFIRVPRCVPEGGLSWSDFQGTPPGGTFAAFTKVPISELDVQGNVMFRAVLDDAGSWVRPRYPGAGARATNGCAPLVARCTRDMTAAGAGATWDRQAPAGCAASVFTAAQATTVGECNTVVGAACDADAVAESARLLQHEQGHFDITCTLVGRADDALAAGRPLATVRTWLNRHAQPQNTRYDNQTAHGCNAGQQSAWESAIAGGLEAVPDP